MLVMNASTMATSSRVMASPEAMQLLSTAPLSLCMMGSKQRIKKAISRGSTAGGAEWSTPGKRKNTHFRGSITLRANTSICVRHR
jgi:hypothetical protein